MKVLMSGGGTGGHVYPAIAIANRIKQTYPNAEILFVGTSNGIESEIVPKNGYQIKTITVQGFKRKIDLDNIKRCFKLVKGLNDARKIVKDFKPDIVIGTGGYVSGPVLYCASGNKNIITVIHEQNSFPGITNKILSKRVNSVITCFDDAKQRFPEETQNKVQLIGNPVRQELLNGDASKSKERLSIPTDKKMVLIYGGSGGFKAINDCMGALINEMVEKDIAFIYATGKRFYDSVISGLDSNKFKPYQRIVPYLDDMSNALTASDVVIGSAGATSLSEITALGKPCILIPKAYTAENHQEYNAKSISDNGAGICILEKNVTPIKLSQALNLILFDDNVLREMKYASLSLGKPNAVDDIFELINNLFKEKKGQ